MFESHQSGLSKSGGRNGSAEFTIPQKFYRIGEIVSHTPYSRQTIHNYTIMGLIKESAWTDGGHRLYDEGVFQRLSRIAELRKTNTLSQIRELFERVSN
jgi:DNA-binding transcriptional MerR regulator